MKTPGPLHGFAALATEATRDALRRRFAIAVAVALALALSWAHTCTRLTGTVVVDQHQLDPAVAAGLFAPALFSFQALTVLVVAGVLASDHLARPLADGSALLWLSRPVSRTSYAAARLVGSLVVGLGAGAILLGGTAALLVSRSGVAVAPVWVAAGATALAMAVVASVAMALSLVLGRLAVLLAVVFGTPLQFFANAVSLGVALVHPGLAAPGLLDTLDRWGPPLGTAVFAAVSAWNPHLDAGAILGPALLRLALWAAAAVALLVAGFRRVEIGS
jgi:ABC-type transport system involved in multi-copper enzyme maturation permease subunit